ncbi:hypothetical protein MMC34_002313 [Xylographa carneopallida]|nr:hypothetical protein [Xylographa carneopallida]
MENGTSESRNAEQHGLNEYTPNDLHTDDDRNVSAASHKRSLSGSILSKLSFLRSSAESRETRNTTSQFDGIDGTYERFEPSQPGPYSSQDPKKTRKRKGSLRKTAILGTGRLRLENREERSSPLELVDTIRLEHDMNGAASPHSPSPESGDDLPTPRQSHERASSVDTSDSNGPIRNMSLLHDNDSDEILPFTSLNRKPTLGDMSTTDDDDVLTFSRSPNLSNSVGSLKKPGGDSYFPIDTTGLQRRRSMNRPKSPLATLPLDPIISSEDWDYADTEWWGWVILVVTWIVFVVGMGSCFGVWSWAWDVGETPYAPPELNDDPTLPIVGYYPALIMLTAIMAWVWVTVAWVGMKYFKHAKISGEDT